MRPNKINILYTIPNFVTAGSQEVLLALYNGMNKEKFDVYVGVEKFYDKFPQEIPGDKQIAIPKSGNYWNDVVAFRKIIQHNNIVLVHSWDYKSLAVEAIATRLSKAKYLYTKKNNAWSKRWKLKSMLSHHIAYDNPMMKENFFNSNRLSHKITFIPHGVNTGLFRPLEKVPKDTFNICCVGTIAENKNQLMLVKALVELPVKVELHLYGNHEETYFQQLTRFIKKHQLTKRVHFHGKIKNNALPDVFKYQDIFVLASKNEGLPVSLLEAMACGVPALSTDSGGGAKYIFGNKEGGLLFDGNRPNELVDLILKLMNNRAYYKSLSEKAVQTVVHRFNVTHEIKKYEALYTKLCLL